MSGQGFDPKYSKKSTKLEKYLDNTESLKRKGIQGGNRISLAWKKQAQEIREKSKRAYGNFLIEARLLMITALADLQVVREGIPGKTNKKLGEILQLTTIFWQGQFCTEQLISEGQYIKACAVLKQEIEIITRIAEVKKGVAKDGRTPNAKYAPSMLHLHYGDMNDIAHISKSAWLDTLTSIDNTTFRAVAIQPIFHEGISRKLYEIHLSIFYNVLLEEIELFQQLYPDDNDVVLPACKLLKLVNELLAKSGFTSD